MLSGVLPIFSTGLYRTEVLRAAGGFDTDLFRYYEDLDTSFRIARQGRLGFIDTPVIFRREHGTNVSSSTNHVRIEKVRCFEKLAKDPSFAQYRKLIYRQWRRSLLALCRMLDRESLLTDLQKELVNSSSKFILRDPRFIYYWLRLRNRGDAQ